MKIKNIVTFWVAVSTLLVLSSCDALNVDSYFEDTFNVDSIFSSKYNIERYYNGAVVLLPDEGKIWQNSYIPGVTATDEAVTCDYGFPIFQSWNGSQFMSDKYTADNSPFNGLWEQMYKIIRKINTMLPHINEVPDMQTADINDLRARGRFVRAYAYFHLLENYGPCLLLGDRILNTNEQSDYYAAERATYDECVDYICTEFEEAAKGLPIKQPLYMAGSPTKGAALALVARLRLEQASDMFNGGASARKYFGNWTRESDGKNYISQTYDEKKWAVAAHAAYRVIELSESNNDLYKLHTIAKDATTPALPANVPANPFPDGAGDIDPLRSYSNLFNGDVEAGSSPQTNPEHVFARMSSGAVNDASYTVFPNNNGGIGNLSVPQKIIDAYYMADGRDINNSSAEYPYVEDQKTFTSETVTFSGYQLNKGVNSMYVNREMRFYASIYFCESFWPMSSTITANKKEKTFTYYSNGNAGMNVNKDYYNLTGYTIKKFIHPQDARDGDQSRLYSKAFPIIRYAEILIAYAEALNNLTQTHEIEENGITYTYSRDKDEISKYFNMIRYRAGLPGLSTTDMATTASLFDVIVRERMIEFLHENRRYYDLRRWGLVEQEESEPIMGMDVTKTKTNGYYQRVPVSHRVVRERNFQAKMIYIPIPLKEIRKVKGLAQNPGWEY